MCIYIYNNNNNIIILYMYMCVCEAPNSAKPKGVSVRLSQGF